METRESKDSPDVAALIAQLPDADMPGAESKLTGPPREEARRIATAILDGGRASLLALIDMIRDGWGGGEKDYRPGYALRCVTLLAGEPGNEERRRLVTDAIVARLGNDETRLPVDARAFLVRELQLVGGESAVEPLGKLLADDALRDDAAMALAAIGGEAARRLRRSWSEVGVAGRVAIANALGACRDADAAGLLEEAASDEDPAVRIAAVRALARTGDERGATAVVRAADRSDGWERIQATRACLELAGRLAADDHTAAARRIWQRLVKTAAERGEPHVTAAAERGLADTAGK